MTEIRTPPDHATCKTHRHYKLNCDQYESLLRRSGQHCEICQRSCAKTSHGKLFIDHQYALWGVRGLLCNPCNSRLRSGPSSWQRAERYLANSWWEQQCSALGLPAGRRPEPGVGSAIRNQWGTIWINAGDWWRAPTQKGHGWSPTNWQGLYRAYGPHNLVPFNMAIIADEPGMWILRVELTGSPVVWAQVCEVTGIALKPGDVYDPAFTGASKPYASSTGADQPREARTGLRTWTG